MSSNRPLFSTSLTMAAVIAMGFGVLAAGVASTKLLWYDEIQTVRLGRLADWHQFWMASLAGFDFTPPLNFAISHWITVLLGEGQVVWRLPQILATVVASICLYSFTSHRSGQLVGLAGLAIYWSTCAFKYAIEARAYAFVLLGGAIFLVGCQRVFDKPDCRSPWLGAVCGGLLIAIGTHVTGVLILLAAIPAYLYLVFVRRNIQWYFLLSVGCGVLPFIQYVPIYWQADLVHFDHPYFRPSLTVVVNSYVSAAGWALLFVPLLAAATLLLSDDGSKLRGFARRLRVSLPTLDWLLVMGNVGVPSLFAVMCSATHKPFISRYGVLSSLGIAVVFAVILNAATFGDISKLRALVSVLAILCVSLAFGAHREMNEDVSSFGRLLNEISRLPTDDTILCPTGNTFLQLDQYGGDSVRRRLVYVTDWNRCMRLVGTDAGHVAFTRGLRYLRPHARVMGYADLIGRERKLWVVKCRSDVWSWSDRALEEDGYTVGGSFNEQCMVEMTRHR
jgi:hypothetical protein